MDIFYGGTFMNYGFVKTACATPDIKVADCVYNSEQIVSQLSFAAQKGASLVVFPELCVTGSTCGDLFKHRFLIQQAESAVSFILQKTSPSISPNTYPRERPTESSATTKRTYG